jgi:hypothetical protein
MVSKMSICFWMIMKSAARVRVQGQEVLMILQDRAIPEGRTEPVEVEELSSPRQSNEQNCRRGLSHSLPNVIAPFVMGLGIVIRMIAQGG